MSGATSHGVKKWPCRYGDVSSMRARLDRESGWYGMGKSLGSFEQTIKLAEDHPDMVDKLKLCMKLASENGGVVPMVETQAEGLTLEDLDLLREYELLE